MAGLALAAPFLVGATRLARALGLAIAREALPAGGGSLDLAAAPRRALVVTIQLAILLLAGIPLVAVTQPFLPSIPTALLLVGAIAVLAVPFWRSATNLYSHARAGAQVVLEALARQSHAGGAGSSREVVTRLVPGLGEASALHLSPGGPAVGRTLRELNLRSLTGASVIAIERGQGEVVFPTGDDVLQAGDALVVTGTDHAVRTALALLGGPPLPAPA
jgi:CPA2 family monovalent cation:H+ antiporter-2